MSLHANLCVCMRAWCMCLYACVFTYGCLGICTSVRGRAGRDTVNKTQHLLNVNGGLVVELERSRGVRWSHDIDLGVYDATLKRLRVLVWACTTCICV